MQKVTVESALPKNTINEVRHKMIPYFKAIQKQQRWKAHSINYLMVK